MKRTPRLILCSVLGVLMLGVMGVLLHFSAQKRHAISCSEVRVEIVDGEKFISSDEVLTYINRGYGVCRGERIDSIGLDRIERMVKDKPAVKDCQAWVTDDGLLHIQVFQREPVMRFDRKGEGYYVDKDGFIFPLCESYTAPVPVIESDLRKGFDSEWLEQAISLVSYISKDSRWNDRILAYEVNGEGDFVLKGENVVFVYGDFANRNRKLSYMEKYYNQIVPSLEEGKQYRKVIIKYNGQIICRKES